MCVDVDVCVLEYYSATKRRMNRAILSFALVEGDEDTSLTADVLSEYRKMWTAQSCPVALHLILVLR